jgi:hypothetical protein
MKTRLILSTTVIALFVAGLAIARPGEGPSPEKRKEFLEKKIAKLPAQEQELARQIQPLRDSLFRAIGQYKHKVHDGAQARSLTAERSTIQSLQASIYALETQNPDVTLDLLADMPSPFMGKDGRGGWGHHRWNGNDSMCAKGGHHPPPEGN